MKINRRIKCLCKQLAALCIALSLWAPPGGVTYAGVTMRLGYDAITGDRVSDLTGNPAFPGSPNTFDVMTTGLVIPMNVANDYGSYVRGFIEAPQTGEYTFWIAAVDSGEFWLSTSTDPAAKALVAQNALMLGQGPNDWFLAPSQESAPISLVRGQKYYSAPHGKVNFLWYDET